MLRTSTLPIEPHFRFAPGAVRPVKEREGAMDEAMRDPWVIDVSRPRKTSRTAGDVSVSVAAVAGLALLAPLAVLAVGTPIAIMVRGLLELILWLLGVQG